MKTCFKCKGQFPMSEFYAHPAMADGTLGKCKQCTRKDTRDRVSRMKLIPEWMRKNRELKRIATAKRRAAGLSKQPSYAVKNKWRMKNLHKVRAQSIARYSVQNSKIAKVDHCQSCGVSGCKLEMHHPDYSHPKLVKWLCAKCHGKTRRKYDPEITYLN